MKILVVQDFLRSGGTERQSVLLANAFAHSGHSTTLLTFRPGGVLAPTVTEDVNRHVLQPFDVGLDWFAPRLLGASAAVAPDVVLCMGRMANCYAGALQRRLGLDSSVIATLRTGKPLPWLFRRSLARVRHVVANSRAARDALVAAHGIAPEKISVIHNSLVFPATNAAEDAHARTTTRSRFGASPDTVVLLNVAMLRPEKNQRELIDIAATLSPDLNWQLWLAGEGPARSECEARIASLGLGARVQLLGWVRDPSSLYAAADVAVHASHRESLSNFLIEAQSHGLPVVASEAQGIRECFVAGKTGWAIAPGDRAGFRAAVERIARATPAEREQRDAAAREFARITFDPARQVDAYLQLFRRLR